MAGASGLRPLLARWRADRGLLLVLVVVVAATAAMVGSVPRLLDELARASLDDELDDATTDRRGLVAARTQRIDLRDPDTTWRRLGDGAETLGERIPAPLADVVGDPVPVVDSLRYVLGAPPGEPPLDVLVRNITIRTQLDLPPLELLEGTLPDGRIETVDVPTGELDVDGDADLRPLPVHEFVATRRTADALRMGVGDQRLASTDPDGPIAARLVPAPSREVVFELAGIVALTPVDDPVWFGDARQHRPIQFDTNSNTTFFTVGIVPPDALGEHPGAEAREPSGVQLRWPLDRAALLAADPEPVRAAALQLRTTLSVTPEDPTWSTGLDRLIAREQARRATAVEVLGLGVVAVAGVAVALLGAVGMLLATRRREAVALVRGRGTSRGQLVTAASLEAAAVAVLGTVVAWALLLVALPGRGGGALVASVGVLATVVLVLAGWPDVRRPLGRLLAERRRRERRSGHGRPVLEGMVVLLAVGAVVAARSRGVTVDGAVDPLVIAAPAAVALAAAVLATRLVPLVLRLLGPLLVAGRRGVVGSLGVARATRRTSGGPVVLLVVLGVGVGATAIGVTTTLATGQARAAAERVAADVRVDAPVRGTLDGDWTPPTAGDLVVDLSLLDGSVVTDVGAQTVRVLLVDADGFAALDEGAALPSLRWDGVGLAPIVLSSSVRSVGEPSLRDAVTVLVGGARIAARVGSFDDRVLGLDEAEDGPFVLIDAEAVVAATGERPLPSTRLVTSADPAAAATSAAAADPAAEVLVRDEVRRGLARAPLARGVAIGFLVATGAASVATLLAVVLALAAAAPARRREAAVLSAVGTSRRSIAATAVAEVVPVVGTAVAAGIGLALGIVAVLGTRLDLAAFTGTIDPTTLRGPTPVAAAVLAGAVLLVASLAAVATIGRVDTAALLREGD